jgi:Rps23 Pro-64 3,4-dihydroxylase Tpa1-like proline 4-hydroxylase
MINYELLESRKSALAAAFRHAKPFRWMMVDGFLNDPWPRRLHDEFGDAMQRSGKNPQAPKKHRHVLSKIGIHRREQMNDVHVQFFDAVQDGRFTRFLEEVTGISPIIADQAIVGGGLHEIYPGGYLNVHTDFNFHPQSGHHRRLNILYYLNPEWREEWEGKLELWPEDFSGPFAEIAPILNRMVIFETSEISYHGHPKPLRFPQGLTRRSLATYYYSNWPAGLERREKTNYRLVPWQVKNLREEIAAMRSQGQDNKTIAANLTGRYEKRDVLQELHGARQPA